MYYVAEFIIKNYIILCLIVSLSVILSLNTIIDKKIVREIGGVLATVFLLTITYYLERHLSQGNVYHPMRLVLSVFNYCVSPFSVVLLLKTVCGRRITKYFIWVPFIINCAVYISAFFCDLAFSFDSANVFHRGKLGYVMQVIFVFYAVFLLHIIVEKFQQEKHQEAFIILFLAGISLLAMVMETYDDETVWGFSRMMIVIDCTYYYMYLHTQMTRADIVEKERILQEQRNELRLSQIQPHFIFNTLGTIRYLCQTDPEKAGTTVKFFADYLRGNIDSIDVKGLIPITKEIEHAQAYTKVETIRFPNIEVSYKIEDEDFEIPALSVQPLVENAIRHGVRIKEKGIVVVRTYEDPDNHYVSIEDNGKGFNKDSIGSDGKNHIGLKNVSERLEGRCDGKMTIESEIGKGTRITISIPKKGGNK